MTKRTPWSPRLRRERRNSLQKASSSLSPTAHPSTSWSPFMLTPVATTTARDTTWPFTRPLRYVASKNT